ncbi:MAG: YraN family protein [Planctomycetaceae bacterium]|nr:YraN family protein [Planctomycetaceae bacterium]
MKQFLRKLLGNHGEREAVRFLKKQGFRILQKQYTNHVGELDIVASEHDTIVFVEVKTRQSTNSGQPFEAVDLRKQHKLTQVALEWLKRYRRLDQPARFDVVSIVWPADAQTPEIQHFRNAFEASGRGQFFS